VGALAQQFQSLKPLHRRLPQPVPQPAAVIVQIHNGNDFPINTRCLCQWRSHYELIISNGRGKGKLFSINSHPSNPPPFQIPSLTFNSAREKLVEQFKQDLSAIIRET
jgi:hypothetical protein